MVMSTPAAGSVFQAGVTTATSTATDAAGNAISCPVVITVVDTEAPSVSDLSVHLSRPRKLEDGEDGSDAKDHGHGRNGRVVDVTLNYGLADNCGASCVLSVEGPREPRHKERESPDWTIVDAHLVRFILDNDTRGPTETYTIRLTCTDAAGNTEVKSATVEIPDHR
jgi:hypothetical protein